MIVFNNLDEANCASTNLFNNLQLVTNKINDLGQVLPPPALTEDEFPCPSKGICRILGWRGVGRGIFWGACRACRGSLYTTMVCLSGVIPGKGEGDFLWGDGGCGFPGLKGETWETHFLRQIQDRRTWGPGRFAGKIRGGVR